VDQLHIKMNEKSGLLKKTTMRPAKKPLRKNGNHTGDATSTARAVDAWKVESSEQHVTL